MAARPVQAPPAAGRPSCLSGRRVVPGSVGSAAVTRRMESGRVDGSTVWLLAELPPPRLQGKGRGRGAQALGTLIEGQPSISHCQS